MNVRRSRSRVRGTDRGGHGPVVDCSKADAWVPNFAGLSALDTPPHIRHHTWAPLVSTRLEDQACARVYGYGRPWRLEASVFQSEGGRRGKWKAVCTLREEDDTNVGYKSLEASEAKAAARPRWVGRIERRWRPGQEGPIRRGKDGQK